MDIRPHSITQSLVHELMLLYSSHSSKSWADDHRSEMVAVALNFNFDLFEARLDPGLNVLWRYHFKPNHHHSESAQDSRSERGKKVILRSNNTQ